MVFDPKKQALAKAWHYFNNLKIIVLTRTIVKPIKRKNKLSNLSTQFNNTILKIGDAVKLFDTNTAAVQQMGNKLVSDIKETASTINQIQTLAQAESITETTEN